jgi:hypothetical protein
MHNYHNCSFVTDNLIKDDEHKNFLIKICRNDLDYLKEHYDRIEKKLINDAIDTESFSEKNVLTGIDQIFIIACIFASNVKIIDFIVKQARINVIDYRIDLNKFNPTYKARRTCLMISSAYNTELSIMKHFIEHYRLDPDIADDMYLRNSLHCAAQNNPNIEIVKYLVEECKMDPNKLALYNDNCLTLSCWRNDNFEIVKYFIEKCKMNINHYDTNNNNSVALLVERINKNEMKIENLAFLLEHNDLYQIDSTILQLNDRLIPYFAHNYKILNRLLYMNDQSRISGSTYLLIDDNYLLTNDINPIMISVSNRIACGIANPFNKREKWNKYVEMVDKLKYVIPVVALFDNISVSVTTQNNDENKFERIDVIVTETDQDNFEPNYTKQTQILFKHNGLTYYGDPCAYRSMIFVRDIVECADFTDAIELEINDLPQYAVNQYVHSLHCNTQIDINRIKLCDFIPFIKFIDRYPTINTSIDILEIKILKYIHDNAIKYDEYFKDLSVRYRLRFIYLDIRCKEIEEIEKIENINKYA